MAASDVSNPEAPGVETPEAALLSRADRQLAAMEDDKNMDRMVIRTRLAEIDRSIKDIEELIAKEKDDTKIATMNLKLADLHEARDKKYAEYKELYGELDAEADEAEVALKEISDLREDIAKQEAKAKELEATKDPAKIREAADLRKEIAEKKEQLKKLTKKDREEDLKAKRDAYREQEKITREEELDQAEKDLDEAAGEATNESPAEEAADADADADEDQSTSSEDPEAKAALKKELLHNTLHKAAHGMSVVLEKDFKEEWDNSYEKMVWNGKALFLKALVLFGGTPKWAELLTKEQLGFMKDHVGIEFSKKTVEVKKDGVTTNEEKWTYKFVKPLEGGDDGITEMSDVFETVYGREGMAKAMEGIKPETTLADLKDTAPESDTSEFAVKTRTLIAAMEQVTPKPTDETKVEEFLTANADKVQKILKPAEETTVAGTPGEVSAEKEHANPIASLAEHMFPELDKMEANPGELRRAFVSGLLVPLSAEDYSYTFDTNTSLVEAYTKAMGSRIKDPQVKADFEGIFAGTLSPDALKNVVDRALTETSDLSEVAIFLITAVGLGDLNGKDAQGILDDAKDGKIEPANLEKMRVASSKAIGVIGESFKEVSLDTALKEYIPRNDEERARLEWAKRHIGYSEERATDNLVMAETTFGLVVDSASKLKLDEVGIGFTGSKMVGFNGRKLEDFGDAKTVELKTLPDGTMKLIVTPKEGAPSVSEFKDVDELVAKLNAKNAPIIDQPTSEIKTVP